MARIYDISQPISVAAPIWPGDPPTVVSRLGSAETEPSVSLLSMGSHTSTHVDPPAHYFPGGVTVDALPLDVLCGPAWVAYVAATGHVTEIDLSAAGIAPGVTRLLLRTRNSDRPAEHFDPDFAAVTSGAAVWLLEREIRLVGIDGPSIEPFVAPGEPVHRALLAAGIVIVENLALARVPPGPCELFCLPLKIVSGDGAPARAIVLTDTEGEGSSHA